VALVTSAVTPTDPPVARLEGVTEDDALKLGPGVGVGAGVEAGVAVGTPVVEGAPVGPGVAPEGVAEGGGAVGGTAAAATENVAAAVFAPKSDFQPTAYALTSTRYVPRVAPAGIVQLIGYVRCSPAPKLSLWNHFSNATVDPPGAYTSMPMTAVLGIRLVTVVVTFTD